MVNKLSLSGSEDVVVMPSGAGMRVLTEKKMDIKFVTSLISFSQDI